MFEPYVILSREPQTASAAKNLYHRKARLFGRAKRSLTPPWCPSGGVIWSFLTEESKILGEEFKKLTEEFNFLSEESKFLTEKFEKLTEDPKISRRVASMDPVL